MQRPIRITGIPEAVMVPGMVQARAEAALEDGWLSVMDCWALDRACRPAGIETTGQALHRRLYGKPGHLAAELPESTCYQRLRRRIRNIGHIEHESTVRWMAASWGKEIDAATDIAADDKLFLHAFLTAQLLRQNRVLVGGATRFFTDDEANLFDRMVRRENYAGLWQFLQTGFSGQLCLG